MKNTRVLNPRTAMALLLLSISLASLSACSDTPSKKVAARVVASAPTVAVAKSVGSPANTPAAPERAAASTPPPSVRLLATPSLEAKRSDVAAAAVKDEEGWHKSVPRPSDAEKTEDLERRFDSDWMRFTYPTGRMPRGDWREAAMKHVKQFVPDGVPTGVSTLALKGKGPSGPIGVSANWTAVGPSPLDSTGTTNNAYQYGDVVGRVNAIAFDPTNPSVAYVGYPVGGLWKTTNCCSAATTWTSLWYDETFPNNSVGAIAVDSANPNVIYVGTGDAQVPAFDMYGDGIYKSTDGGATWFHYGGNIMSPYTSNGAPGAACCASAPDENIKSIVIDPRNHNTVIAGASYGLYISYDAGVTWTQYDVVPRNQTTPINYTTSAQRVTSILIDGNTNPSTMYVALGYPYTSTRRSGLIGGANGVYKATVPSSGAPTFTLIKNGLPSTVADGTVTSNFGRIELAWNSAHTHIYAHVDHYANVGQTLGIYHYNVATDTWNLLTGTGETSWSSCGTGGNETDQAWYDLTLDMDPNDDTILYTGRTNFWKVTLNSATAPTSATLTDLSGVYSTGCSQYGSLHPDQHAYAYQTGSNPTRFLVGNDGGIYYGTGAAGGFTRVMSGLGALQFYAGQTGFDFANTAGNTTQYAWGGMQDNGNATWDSSQTNQRWVGRGTGGDGFFTAFDPIGGTITAGRWMHEYTNGDTTCSSGGADGPFASCAPAYGATEREDWSTPFILDQWNCSTTRCDNLVLGTNNVWATTNFGNTAQTLAWTKVTTTDLTKGSGDALSINVAHSNPGSVIVGTSDGNVQWSNNVFTGANCTAAAANTATFACTANAASTWVNLTGSNAVLPNRAIAGVVFDPTVDTIFYAAVAGFGVNTPSQPGHVYRGVCAASPCTAANVTWTNKSSNLPDVPVEGIQVNPANPKQVFIGTNLGFYYTNDITVAAPVWNRYQTGMPNTRIAYLAVDRGPTAATARSSTTLSAWTYGRGLYVTKLAAIPSCDPPAVPAPTTSAPANNNITVAWGASAGAASYKVYRAGPLNINTCPANGFTNIATVSAPTTSYADTTVSGGSYYFYRVAATSASCGESVPSSCVSRQATGTCTVPPSAPTALAAATPPGATCAVNLSWNAGSSNCAGAVSYNVYRSGASGTLGSKIASGVSATSYSDTSITPGTYYYTVRTVDSVSGAEETNTTQVAATPKGVTTQLYFENFDALAAGNLAGYTAIGTGAAEWSGARACTPTQSGANIFRFGPAGCATSYAKATEDTQATSNSFAIPAATLNTRLEFYHRWDFGTGDGAYLDVKRSTDAGWTRVPSGAIVTGAYTGTVNGSNGWTGTVNTAMTQTVVDLDAACNAIAGNTGGCAGKTILFAFHGFQNNDNSRGTGWFIDDVKLTYDTPCVIGCTPPGSSTISTAATAANQVTVTLTSAATGATTYNLYRVANNSACPVAGSPVVTGLTAASFPYVDNNLKGGSAYTYQIEAVDSTGGCKTKSNCSTTVAWGDCLTAPTGVAATGVVSAGGSSCGLTVSWSGGSASCGGPLTYSVYRVTGTVASFTPSASNRIAQGLTGTSFTDTSGLVASTAYSYIVRGVDSANSVEDTNTTAKSATTAAGCTVSPQNVIAFTVTSSGTAVSGQNLLEWMNPAGLTAGTTVKVNYRTDAYPTGPNDAVATTLFTGRPATAGAPDSYTHTGLTNGTTYYYAIWLQY